MGWKLRAAVIFVVGFLIAGCLWFGYVVRARYQGNEYVVQLTAAFNAASLVNGEETYTDAERAVVSEYDGRRYVVLPENYKAIVSLLHRHNAMPLLRRVGKDAPLSIVICDAARIRVEPEGEDAAYVSLVTDAGKGFTMHIRGGNIWKQILEYATLGHSENRNIPV